MHNFLIQVLGKNQLALGALLTMALGGILSQIKTVPETIWSFILSQFTVCLTITDSTEGFNWFKSWVSKKDNILRRRLDLHTPYINGKCKILYSLSPGNHYFTYKHRLGYIHFKRQEEKAGSGYGDKRTESFIIRLIGRDKQVLQQLISEIYNADCEVKNNDPKLYFWHKDYWVRTDRKLRSLESVILPVNLKESIVNDIQIFKKSEKQYEALGIPYHRGFLFYGEPGTGKTALTTALANELKSSIYFVKLNEMNDASLADSFRQINGQSLIVLEDVDCVVPTRENNITIEDKVECKFGVTLSGLLNVLDGLQAPTGVIYILTTNNPNKLDSALLRPGRIDVKVEFKCGLEEAILLYQRFFPNISYNTAKVVVKKIKSNTMAEYQSEFLKLLGGK